MKTIATLSIIGCLVIAILTLTSGPAIAQVTIDFTDVIGPGPQYYGSNLFWTNQDIDLIEDRIIKSNMNIMRLILSPFFIENPNDNGDPDTINWSGFHFDYEIPWGEKTVSYATIFEKLKTLDIDIMVFVPYLSPWLSANNHSSDDIYSTYPPNDYGEYGEFIYAVLYHMTNTVLIPPEKIILEPYNEPDLGCGQDPSVHCFWSNHSMHDTADTFITAYNAAKSVSPAIRVVGMAEWNDGSYITDFINNHNGLNYLDGITYHKYVDNYNISSLITMGTGFMEYYGLPVFANEYGSRTWGSEGTEGALWNSYTLTHLLKSGIQPLQHPFSGFPGLGQPYESMGLFYDWNNDWQIKEAFWVNSNILRFMKDTVTLKSVDGSQNLDIISGKRNEEINVVITNRDPIEKNVNIRIDNLPPNYRQITVYDNFKENHTLDVYGISSNSFDYVVPSRSSTTIIVAASIQNSPPVANDQVVSTDKDTPVNITLTASDVNNDPLTYSIVSEPSNGMLTGLEPDLIYTPDGGFTGTDSFVFSANDGMAESNATVNITVANTTTALMEFGQVVVGADRITVSLRNTYTSPVIVSSIQYQNNVIPVVSRISNVTSTSFDFRLQNPSGNAISAENVSYLVVEEGVHTIDGVNIEAQTYLSTVTDSDGSWVGESQGYTQNYTSPVILGQVMTENDDRWSVFWNQGSSRTSPPSATVLRTGKTVCEDTDTVRENETIGFIVFEAGHGTIGDVEFEALVGADTVRGVTNSAPYTYAFDTPFQFAPQVVLTTMAGVDGGNGGWAYAHGATAATASSLYLSIDEDQINDSERNHTTEQSGYIVFSSPISNDPPTAYDQLLMTNEDDPIGIVLVSTDSDGDLLSYSITTPPGNGFLSGTAPNVTYVPDADYDGSDSFTFRSNDGHADSNEATVSIEVNPVNDAPSITGIPITTVVQDTQYSFSAMGHDVDGDTLSFSIVSKPDWAIFDPVTGTLSGTPGSNNIGTTTDILISVTDDHFVVSLPAFDLTVTSANNPPIADAQSVTTGKDTPIAITLTGSDVDDDALTFNIVSSPGNGILNGTAPNVTYVPDTDYSGPDSFTFRAYDGLVDSNEATVTIVVENPAPSESLMHVNAVEVTKNAWWILRQGAARVQIVDAEGLPVQDATVSGQWSGGVNDPAQFITGPDGWGTANTKWIWGDATFTFCVGNTTKDGWEYIPDANTLTCGATN